MALLRQVGQKSAVNGGTASQGSISLHWEDPAEERGEGVSGGAEGGKEAMNGGSEKWLKKMYH